MYEISISPVRRIAKKGSTPRAISCTGMRAMPLITKVGWLAKAVGLPYIPVTPTLPLLGPLGLIPYPTKWYIDFGEPIDVTHLGDDVIGDRVQLNKLNEELRATIQRMIDERLRERKTIFGG